MKIRNIDRVELYIFVGVIVMWRSACVLTDIRDDLRVRKPEPAKVWAAP